MYLLVFLLFQFMPVLNTEKLVSCGWMNDIIITDSEYLQYTIE